MTPHPSIIDPASLDLAALRLPPHAHKGSRGSVGIIGGAPGMVGAVWLAGRAALHSGAGRVYVGQMDPSAPAVDPLYPELMLRPAGDLLAGWHSTASSAMAGQPEGLPLTALVAGPGMGTSAAAATLLAQTLDVPLPLLLDADALNLLSRRADLADRLRARAERVHDSSPAVLTPHPAEAARLLHKSLEEVQADRLAAAVALVERYGTVAVLKGAGTLVAWPTASPPDDLIKGSNSTSVNIACNPTGSNRLATAGTGDVLSGLIGALLGRGLAVTVAAQLGVWLHGLAGERMPDERPTASGLLPPLSQLLAEYV